MGDSSENQEERERKQMENTKLKPILRPFFETQPPSKLRNFSLRQCPIKALIAKSVSAAMYCRNNSVVVRSKSLLLRDSWHFFTVASVTDYSMILKGNKGNQTMAMAELHNFFLRLVPNKTTPTTERNCCWFCLIYDP